MLQRIASAETYDAIISTWKTNMSPLKPHWKQPSHADIQEVIINEHEFTSKSLSRVTLPPFGLYAKMEFPPCDLAEEPSYATVQFDKNKHLNLNSDLLYINHSCEPSLIFDTGNLNILAGPNGLQAGEELTFFYPSTEWDMAQSFDCLCGKPTCRGRISGAKDMTSEQLEGLWINGHIRELLEQKAIEVGNLSEKGNGTAGSDQGVTRDPTAQALKDALKQAEKVAEAARFALRSYVESSRGHTGEIGHEFGSGANAGNPSSNAYDAETLTASSEHLRRGPTSRELSGEMGGDTAIAA
ncbi:galactose-proton symport [Seiridium cupressi]